MSACRLQVEYAEIAACAVMKDILQTPPIETKTKFTFMFSTPDYLLKRYGTSPSMKSG
ncbi:hypothetical protein MKX03_037794 [Papaver bracteatum]|nr:hypothetical protein MKX03_037794 [Papaver bracteatum]